MCELFGICGKKEYQINNYLKEFFSHSENHPHGWGLAIMEGDESSVEKEPLKASKSLYLKRRLSVPVLAKIAFAHIRYATIGNEEYENCHPFTQKDNTGRRWTLIHNGTIFDYPPMSKYIKSQKGDTDSERILMYIVDKINRSGRTADNPWSKEERFCFLDCLVKKLSKGNKLNMLLFDGEVMYVHTNYANSLYYLKKEESIFFSTQPLGKEQWDPVPFTTLLAYEEGELLFTGTNHENEYIENAEDMKYIYQIFSNL